MVGDALLDLIFSPEENDGVGLLIGKCLPSDVWISFYTLGMHGET